MHGACTSRLCCWEDSSWAKLSNQRFGASIWSKLILCLWYWMGLWSCLGKGNRTWIAFSFACPERIFGNGDWSSTVLQWIWKWRGPTTHWYVDIAFHTLWRQRRISWILNFEQYSSLWDHRWTSVEERWIKCTWLQRKQSSTNLRTSDLRFSFGKIQWDSSNSPCLCSRSSSLIACRTRRGLGTSAITRLRELPFATWILLRFSS